MILRVKERLDSNQNVEDCLAKTLLLEQAKEGLDWEDICMLTVAFTIGGVHSVSSQFKVRYVQTSPLIYSRRRSPILFCGLLFSLHHILMCSNVHTRNSTRSLEGKLGQARKTRSNYRTSEQSSRKLSDSVLPS